MLSTRQIARGYRRTPIVADAANQRERKHDLATTCGDASHTLHNDAHTHAAHVALLPNVLVAQLKKHRLNSNELAAVYSCCQSVLPGFAFIDCSGMRSCSPLWVQLAEASLLEFLKNNFAEDQKDSANCVWEASMEHVREAQQEEKQARAQLETCLTSQIIRDRIHPLDSMTPLPPLESSAKRNRTTKGTDIEQVVQRSCGSVGDSHSGTRIDQPDTDYSRVP